MAPCLRLKAVQRAPAACGTTYYRPISFA